MLLGVSLYLVFHNSLIIHCIIYQIVCEYFDLYFDYLKPLEVPTEKIVSDLINEIYFPTTVLLVEHFSRNIGGI